jgi:tetratricopeptide (TPR) repeat protein
VLAVGQAAETGSLEALFNEGAAAYGKGDYAKTVALFSEILRQAKPGPELESIYFTLAVAKLRQGDNDGAIDSFRLYLRTYPTGSQINDARAGLTQALVNASRIAEALASIGTLRELGDRSGSQGIDNYANLLSLTLHVADALVDAEKPAEALALLQSALRRDKILHRQRERVADLARLLRQASVMSGSAGLGSAAAANREALAARLKDASEALKALEENPSFDVPRLLLQARCHLVLDQPWEAVVVYRHILDNFPKSSDTPYALQGLVHARQASNRPADALLLAERFISEFPDHALATEIAALGGQLALEQGKIQAATSLFGSALEKSQGEVRQRILFQLGLARFAGADWAGSRETLDRYIADFPAGEWAENAAYRSALTWFLDLNDAKRYEKAEKALKAFIKTHPSSAYLSDARYRLAVCQFAFQEYEQALASCTEWEKLHPDDGLLPEVLSLKGDVCKTLGREDDALTAYLDAASAASTDQVLSYALSEAAKLLEARKDWARLSELFRTQVSRQPDSPLVFGWYYWIARAEARAGHPGQAWDFLAERIASSLADPKREDVETLLRLMAQIRVRQRKDDPAPIPSLAERLPDATAPLARARLAYYESFLLRNSRKPAEADAALLAIGTEYDPGALSAPLLAETGQALLKAGHADRASANFAALLETFGKSTYRDYAYVGQGDLALAAGQPAAALQAYQNAIDLAGAEHLLREATLGRARALYELGRLDEAAKLFEVIAASKEWRGEPTAASLHHLGLIAAKQGDLPKANAFFQRVFVSQGRYPEWVARSYIESGRAFEKLSRPGEAAATYREMLRNERLAGRSELEDARARLAVLAP